MYSKSTIVENWKYSIKVKMLLKGRLNQFSTCLHIVGPHNVHDKTAPFFSTQSVSHRRAEGSSGYRRPVTSSIVRFFF